MKFGTVKLMGTIEDVQINNTVIPSTLFSMIYRVGDREDYQRALRSQIMCREPKDAIGAYGERETSGGLTHAQRVMRKIRITHRHEDELDPRQVY
jgi:hypothetical protein